MNITKHQAANFDLETAVIEIMIDRIDRKLMVNREAGDDQKYHKAQAHLADAITILRVHPTPKT